MNIVFFRASTLNQSGHRVPASDPYICSQGKTFLLFLLFMGFHYIYI